MSATAREQANSHFWTRSAKSRPVSGLLSTQRNGICAVGPIHGYISPCWGTLSSRSPSRVIARPITSALLSVRSARPAH